VRLSLPWQLLLPPCERWPCQTDHHPLLLLLQQLQTPLLLRRLPQQLSAAGRQKQRLLLCRLTHQLAAAGQRQRGIVGNLDSLYLLLLERHLLTPAQRQQQHPPAAPQLLLLAAVAG
jgi:hypothetical protein